MDSETKETIRVSEYMTAALLKTSGIRLTGVDGTDRIILSFDNTGGKAEGILDEHRNGGVMVNSADYAAAINEVKSLIFGRKRETSER